MRPLRPNGTARAEGEGRVFGPHVVRRRVAGLDGAARHGVGNLQSRKLRVSARDRPDLELAVGRLRHQLGEVIGAALQRVEHLGQLVSMRHLTSGDAWAMAGAASGLAAVAAPATPAAFRNLRRSMLAMTADLLEHAAAGGQGGKNGDVGRHAPLGLLAAAHSLRPACAVSICGRS